MDLGTSQTVARAVTLAAGGASLRAHAHGVAQLAAPLAPELLLHLLLAALVAALLLLLAALLATLPRAARARPSRGWRSAA